MADGKQWGQVRRWGGRGLRQPTLLAMQRADLWLLVRLPARVLEYPAHVDVHGPKGAQRDDLALCCPIKNKRRKSLPPCQDILITLTGSLSPPFAAYRPEKRETHTGETGWVT